MTSVEEIISRLQGVVQRLDDGVHLLSAAEQSANQLQAQMVAAGVQDKAAMFAQVRDSIARTRQYLTQGKDLTGESINRTKAAGG